MAGWLKGEAERAARSCDPHCKLTRKPETNPVVAGFWKVSGASFAFPLAHPHTRDPRPPHAP